MECRNQKIAISAVGALYASSIAVVAKAIHKAYAAHRDEQNHYPYTSAMEWREAAELLAPNTFAAEYCWRHWERIMRLPRRLAAPIGVSQPSAVPLAPASASPSVVVPISDQVWCANAA